MLLLRLLERGSPSSPPPPGFEFNEVLDFCADCASTYISGRVRTVLVSPLGRFLSNLEKVTTGAGQLLLLPNR